jgi:hypothetical protein
MKSLANNLPFPPNPTFIGRDSELKNLSEQLQKVGEMAITQTIAVHGLGGVGKTQLAVEYAWKHLGDYDAVLWVKADSPEALDSKPVKDRLCYKHAESPARYWDAEKGKLTRARKQETRSINEQRAKPRVLKGESAGAQ